MATFLVHRVGSAEAAPTTDPIIIPLKPGLIDDVLALSLSYRATSPEGARLQETEPGALLRFIRANSATTSRLDPPLPQDAMILSPSAIKDVHDAAGELAEFSLEIDFSDVGGVEVDSQTVMFAVHRATYAPAQLDTADAGVTLVEIDSRTGRVSHDLLRVLRLRATNDQVKFSRPLSAEPARFALRCIAPPRAEGAEDTLDFSAMLRLVSPTHELAPLDRNAQPHSGRIVRIAEGGANISGLERFELAVDPEALPPIPEGARLELSRISGDGASPKTLLTAAFRDVSPLRLATSEGGGRAIPLSDGDGDETTDLPAQTVTEHEELRLSIAPRLRLAGGYTVSDGEACGLFQRRPGDEGTDRPLFRPDGRLVPAGPLPLDETMITTEKLDEDRARSEILFEWRTKNHVARTLRVRRVRRTIPDIEKGTLAVDFGASSVAASIFRDAIDEVDTPLILATPTASLDPPSLFSGPDDAPGGASDWTEIERLPAEENPLTLLPSTVDLNWKRIWRDAYDADKRDVVRVDDLALLPLGGRDLDERLLCAMLGYPQGHMAVTPAIPARDAYERPDLVEFSPKLRLMQAKRKFSSIADGMRRIYEVDKLLVTVFGETFRNYIAPAISRAFADAPSEEVRIDRVAFTYPTRFDRSQLSVMMRAAKQAVQRIAPFNLGEPPDVKLVPEADSAGYMLLHRRRFEAPTEGYAVVFDCGAGTIDLSAIRYRREGPEADIHDWAVLHRRGAPFGGYAVDLVLASIVHEELSKLKSKAEFDADFDYCFSIAPPERVDGPARRGAVHWFTQQLLAAKMALSEKCRAEPAPPRHANRYSGRGRVLSIRVGATGVAAAPVQARNTGAPGRTRSIEASSGVTLRVQRGDAGETGRLDFILDIELDNLERRPRFNALMHFMTRELFKLLLDGSSELRGAVQRGEPVRVVTTGRAALFPLFFDQIADVLAELPQEADVAFLTEMPASAMEMKSAVASGAAALAGGGAKFGASVYSEVDLDQNAAPRANSGAGPVEPGLRGERVRAVDGDLVLMGESRADQDSGYLVYFPDTFHPSDFSDPLRRSLFHIFAKIENGEIIGGGDAVEIGAVSVVAPSSHKALLDFMDWKQCSFIYGPPRRRRDRQAS